MGFAEEENCGARPGLASARWTGLVGAIERDGPGGGPPSRRQERSSNPTVTSAASSADHTTARRNSRAE
jgi:hypothetical protein